MNEYINEHFKNGSILLFWNVMNLLPDRNPTQTGRSQGTDVAEEVDSFNYNQQDYAIYTEDYGLSKNLAYWNLTLCGPQFIEHWNVLQKIWIRLWNRYFSVLLFLGAWQLKLNQDDQISHTKKPYKKLLHWVSFTSQTSCSLKFREKYQNNHWRTRVSEMRHSWSRSSVVVVLFCLLSCRVVSSHRCELFQLNHIQLQQSSWQPRDSSSWQL